MSPVQSKDTDFNIHTLGWKGFQDLTLSICSVFFGDSVKSYQTTNDGGRDGYFSGNWNSKLGFGVDGSITIQSKHTSKNDNPLTLSLIKKEFSKISDLVVAGKADNYLIFTNHTVTAETELEIEKQVLALGVKSFHLFSRSWINLKILQEPKLRMLVPRVYGLGDLSQIIDERAYLQAKEVLFSLSDELNKFVVTNSYKKSVEALHKFGFVFLLGEAASGKSTIAATLSLCAIDQWKCSVLKIESAEDFVKHWNPDEPNQFFWVDDVFGATQYQKSDADSWNKIIPKVDAAIKKGVKIIFTSRDYIYKAAISDLKYSSFPLIKESQVIIEVEKLSIDEKKLILYNHLKLGNQSIKFKSSIKKYLDKLSESKHFLPEIARRLGNSMFTKNLVLNETQLNSFFDQPKEFLISVLENLNTELRSALTIIFMNQGRIESPVILSSDDVNALDKLGVSKISVSPSLNLLKDSLVKLKYFEGKCFWIFKHPSISDSISSIISNDQDLLEIYLRGSKAEIIIREITCGFVNIENVKLIIPEKYFDIVVKKISELKNRSDICSFLNTRCNDTFIKYFLSVNSYFLESLQFYSYFYACAEASFIGHLYNLGLLPESIRKNFVESAFHLALQTPDAGCFTIEKIRIVFKPEEISFFQLKLKDYLVDTEGDPLGDWLSGFGSHERNDPDNYYLPVADTLEEFKLIFRNDPDIYNMTDVLSREIHEKISEIKDSYRDSDYDEDYFRDNGVSSNRSYNSIFDDIDE